MPLVKEMQIKTTAKHYFLSVRKTKVRKYNSVDTGVGKQDFSYIFPPKKEIWQRLSIFKLIFL